MKKKNKPTSMQLDIKFENFGEVDNKGFVKGQCKIAYAGKNRNYSDIPKIAFENAEKSLFNIPVVGHWLDDISNFGGHDAILEKRGTKLILKDNTIPYGVVPESANPRWVEVEDDNGNIKNYYTADVILWYEKYPEQIQKVIDGGSNQSMEIMVRDGEWDDNYDYFIIKDFYFSALCLLGRDLNEDGKKGENDVEPCFEDSEIITYQFENNKQFTKKFNELVNAFSSNDIENHLEGGEKNMKIKDNEIQLNKFKIELQELQNQKDLIEQDNQKTKSQLEVIIKEKEELEHKYNSLKNQYSDFETIKKQRDDLQEYKNEKIKEQKEQIFTSFSTLLTEEEMKPIKNKINDYSIEEIDLRLSKINSDKFKMLKNSKQLNGNEDFQMENFNKHDSSHKKQKNQYAL